MNEKIILSQDERLDDLLCNDMHIVQNKKLYTFTSDAVLLANFIKAKKTDKVVDLCSGSGVVGILFYAKNECDMSLVELQKPMFLMSQKSLILNNIEDKVKAFNCSVQDSYKLLGQEKFDIVLCNPPYKKPQNHNVTEIKEIAMCKYELMLTFEELCVSASKLLRFGGKFVFVHDTSRLTEIISTLKKYHLEPKKIEFCFPKNKQESNVVLIEAVKGGKEGCKVTKINN